MATRAAFLCLAASRWLESHDISLLPSTPGMGFSFSSRSTLWRSCSMIGRFIEIPRTSPWASNSESHVASHVDFATRYVFHLRRGPLAPRFDFSGW